MFTCPYCGGEAIDESGNDALVCTECGRLFSLDEASDDERETAEAEKRVMGQLMAEQDAVGSRRKRLDVGHGLLRRGLELADVEAEHGGRRRDGFIVVAGVREEVVQGDRGLCAKGDQRQEPC